MMPLLLQCGRCSVAGWPLQCGRCYVAFAVWPLQCGSDAAAVWRCGTAVWQCGSVASADARLDKNDNITGYPPFHPYTRAPPPTHTHTHPPTHPPTPGIPEITTYPYYASAFYYPSHLLSPPFLPFHFFPTAPTPVFPLLYYSYFSQQWLKGRKGNISPPLSLLLPLLPLLYAQLSVPASPLFYFIKKNKG